MIGALYIFLIKAVGEPLLGYFKKYFAELADEYHRAFPKK